MTNGQTTESHEWYRELLGAYALDALLPDERAALEAHLAGCAECRVELDALRVGVKAFALTADEREPSPELRNRVWEAIWAEPNFNRGDSVDTQPSSAEQPVVAPVSIAEARATRSSRLPLLSAIAAALALLLVGSLLAWSLSLRADRSDLESTVVALEDGATSVAVQNEATVVALQGEVTAVAGQGEATTVGQLASQSEGVPAGGEVQYLSNREVLLIELHDLPPLPEGQVYQLWLIVGDQVNPSNVFVPESDPDQPTTISVSADPSEIDALAITREPGPIGSISATTDPILVGEI